MTLEEAIGILQESACPSGCYADPLFRKKIYDCSGMLKFAIKVLQLYIKNTTIDCFEPIKGQIYTVSIRSKITNQIEYEDIIEFLKKYNKEEYEKCLNNFTSK